MEFHRRFNKNERKEIINKKRAKEKSKLLQRNSESNFINIKHYPEQNLYKPGKDKNEKENLYELDGNDLYFYQRDSLNNDININQNYKINNIKDNKKRMINSSLEDSNQSIKKYPVKKTFSQSLITNPLNKIEYPGNRIIDLSEIKESKSYIINNDLDMNNNKSNNNELDVEVNSKENEKEDSLSKIRYHRTRIYSPFYNNINRIYNQEQEDDIIDYTKEYYIDELNESENNRIQKINNIKSIDNTLQEKQFIYSSDDCQDNTLLSKNEENKKRKLVRKYSDLYEPGKNKKGILLPKAKMTFSLSSSPLSIHNDKKRNLSKNSKLSELIMSRKRNSPDNFRTHSLEEYFSCSEDKTTWQNDSKKRPKKTFKRESFEKYQKNKTLIRLNKSPEERFRNISLAMISSKGKNTENRPISSKMRFERGGVVDLIQNDGKKHNYKYLIKKMTRPIGKQIIHNNPKYREQAAKLIKEWWFAVKEYKEKRNESATLIQSYFRGRFVRKYLYDVIYMNYIYFGFCKKIEKFIKKKYGPYFFKAIFAKFIKQKSILKKIIIAQNKKRIKSYLKKWILINKKNNRKNLALLYILRIRAIRESKMFNLKRVFSKWNYISIISKERNDYNLNKKDKINKEKYDDKGVEKEINKIEEIKENDGINKIKGLFKIFNGTDKFIKKKALDITGTKLKIYLKKISKIKNDEIIDLKLELFIKKLEPYINNNKSLYNLFMKSIIIKINKLKNIKKKNKEKDNEEYIFTKEYENKKIKRKKIEEYDIIEEENSESQTQKENSDKIDKKENESLSKEEYNENISEKKDEINNKNDNKEKKKIINMIKLIKQKYLLKLINISDNIRNRIMAKYLKLWYDKTKIKSSQRNYLIKFMNRKEHLIKGLQLNYLLKWQYHSKLDIMQRNITIIQNEYRKYKNDKTSMNNWMKLKYSLSIKKRKKEINDINNDLKKYIFINKIKRYIIKRVNKDLLIEFKKFNKESIFKGKIIKIINTLDNKKNNSLIKKYFDIWKNNMIKDAKREEKLNYLLYIIEKRMNINSVKYLYEVSLIKKLYDAITQYRKYESYKILMNYLKSKKIIDNFSKNLSSAFTDIRSKEKKIITSKLLKYFIYIKLIKLLDKIRINRNKEVKQYKIKLIKYIKSKKAEFSSSEKRKKNSYQYMSPKQKQKYDNKKLDKTKTKSQGIITISNKKTKNYKEKEPIYKNSVKGYNNVTNKKKYIKGQRVDKIEKDKFKEGKLSKSESEYESENNQIKENINTIYKPLLESLNKIIKKIIIRKKKEYLLIIKKNIKIVEEEKKEEKIYYVHKLYKALRRITIKKLMFQKDELLRAKKIINLIKITRINSQISMDRWIRQIIRRWRFLSFVKIMSKKKLELMYKNLHMGYLEIINSLFKNENQSLSMLKEFENFGSNIGMYTNSDNILNKEKDLYQRVKKKYISKPIEYDKQNLLNIESGKFINDLKYKSDEEPGEDNDYNNIDSDKDAFNKMKNGLRRSVNYDRDKP